MRLGNFAGIKTRILDTALYLTLAVGSEIAESPSDLALRQTSSYTYGIMFYFAYGSNLNLEHLTGYLDTHGVTLDTEFQAEYALLQHYRLRTNYFAGSHGAGACNIEPAHDHRVEGVVMSITPIPMAKVMAFVKFPGRWRL